MVSKLLSSTCTKSSIQINQQAIRYSGRHQEQVTQHTHAVNSQSVAICKKDNEAMGFISKLPLDCASEMIIQNHLYYIFIDEDDQPYLLKGQTMHMFLGLLLLFEI